MSPKKNRKKIAKTILDYFNSSKYSADEFIIHFDIYGNWKYISENFSEILGYSSEEIIPKSFFDFVHPEDRESTLSAFRQIQEGRIIANFENRLMAISGKYEWFSWVAIPNLEENFIIAIYQNITLQREIEKEFVKQELKYKNVFENLPMGIAITDEKGYILEVNPAAREIFEIAPGVSLKRSLNYKRWKIVTKSGSSLLPREFNLLRALRSKQSLRGLEFGLQKEGSDPKSIIWLEMMASPLHIEGYGMAVGIKDITERKRAQERSAYLANYDDITGLPRKKFFTEKLNVMLEESMRHGYMVGIIALDIDNFKYLNESFGHKFGDLFLVEVAKLIQGSIRNFDLVSREGGDEYLIALPDIDNEADTALICESIQEALSKPIQVHEFSAFTSVSMGISIFPNDGKDSDTLIKNADSALHQAKKKGKNSYSFYKSELQGYVTNRLELENNLRMAIKRDEFELYYQPKIDIQNNRVVGVEALIRWNHREKGMIPPMEFIPLAEETGLIVPIGEMVLEKAICNMAEWKHLHGDGFHMSVNLSTKQFNHEFLATNIKNYLDRYNLNPAYLDLEITESSLMDNAGSTELIVRNLHNLGISITIDDFGTGYSSLGYLKRFPVHALKIDRCFIQDLEHDEDSQVIVKAVINLGHNLGLKVVAEGAENNLQCQILRTLDADSIQGFYYSHPLDFQSARKYIESYPNSK